MIWFYFIEGIFIGLIALLLFFQTALVKRFLNWINQRSLFILPGIFEIVLGLATVYLRQKTALKALVTIVGLMLFIDGVFYLLTSEKLSKTFDWLMTLEDRSFRTYSIFIVIISLGLLAAALLPVK